MTGFAGLKGPIQFRALLAPVAMVVGVAAIASFLQTTPAIEAWALAACSWPLLMTVDALHLRVLRPQIEARNRVVKVGDFPSVLAMAARAVAAAKFGTHIVAVLIFVAAETLLRLQLGPGVFNIVFAFTHMALVARMLGMSPYQLVAGFFLVIEANRIFP